jgi:hypothetical protein
VEGVTRQPEGRAHLEREIVRLEERIAAEAARAQSLVEHIKQVTQDLSTDERTAVGEQWLKALDIRIAEFEATERKQLPRIYKYWTGGIAIGSMGGAVLTGGAIPAGVVVGIGVALVAPKIASDLRRLQTHLRALSTRRKVRRALQE